MDRRLVDHFVNANIVSRQDMQRLILRASKEKKSLLEQLLDDRKADEHQVAREVAAYYGLPLVDGHDFSVDRTALKFISREMAIKHGVLPFAISDGADHVDVAVFDPQMASDVVDTLQVATGNEPSVHIAPRGWLERAIRHFYDDEPWSSVSNADVFGASGHEERGLLGDTPTRVAEDDEIAPAKHASTTEGSAVILLEEVVTDNPPFRPNNPLDDTPHQPDLRAVPSPPRPREERRPTPKPRDEVAQALEDFDAFLDSGRSYASASDALPAAGSASADLGESPWDNRFEKSEAASLSSGDVSSAGFAFDGGRAQGSGMFDLFDEQSEARVEPPLSDLVAQHEKTIERLRQEILQQREIIAALVDLLSDANIISKRELKRRARGKS